jgi:hypothetical protein
VIVREDFVTRLRALTRGEGIFAPEISGSHNFGVLAEYLGPDGLSEERFSFPAGHVSLVHFCVAPFAATPIVTLSLQYRQ